MTTNDLPPPRPSSPAPRPSPLITWFLTLNALALVLAAIWLRCHALENIPGVNGDEAWYGVRAWWILHGGPYGGWHTPTGNPLNPLLIGPLALLHLWLPPSIVLLRSAAVAGGLAALAINWLFCRWVFDRRTAAISTVLLAVLPINIAYSRFAWDASQSLAATLPVVYLALAAVRFPNRFGRWIAAALLAQAIAVWVHPTNIFAGAAIVAACAARWSKMGKNDEARMTSSGQSESSSFVVRHLSLVILILAGLVLAAWIWAAGLTGGPLAGRLARRLGDVRESVPPAARPPVAVLFPRLFTGGTAYRYIPGSRSWFEWPLPAHLDGWGLDVVLFWGCVFGSAWLLWQSGDGRLRLRTIEDRVLLAAWVLTVAAFALIAGPQALTPGQERFAICLIGPTVLLLARGAALAWQAASTRWRVVLAMATLAGWPLLADFHTHYFRFIERTGGQSHPTFRTAAVEPKQAALQSILEDAKGTTWIVCSQWWNRWPIRYLALPHGDFRVPDPEEIVSSTDYRRALAEGRVWFVEFCDTEGLRRAEAQLADRKPTSRQFLDYGRRPVLCVLHPAGSGSKSPGTAVPGGENRRRPPGESPGTAVPGRWKAL